MGCKEDDEDLIGGKVMEKGWSCCCQAYNNAYRDFQ